MSQRMKPTKPSKELYQQLRQLPCGPLWDGEVSRFNAAAPRERTARVAVIRAVGVVFSESGSEEQKLQARQWLAGLLKDPDEKVRRYAAQALPKLGSGTGEESELISLLGSSAGERERKAVAKSLAKIGGAATLQALANQPDATLIETRQKVQASLVRASTPSRVRMTPVLEDFQGLSIHLRGRRGLESFVRDEAADYIRRRGRFTLSPVAQEGVVVLHPIAPFSLADLYSMRCFGTVGLVLGSLPAGSTADWTEPLARLIASPLSQRILRTWTDGSLRYRIDFANKGHLRGLVSQTASRAYALCPEVLNDPSHAPWTVSIHSTPQGNSVELRPKLVPDPRFAYRLGDIPAASHPPLAASLARLAGPMDNEVVWDPFCGSGLELIERALLGGVRLVIGTDLSREAIEIAQTNFNAVNLPQVKAQFIESDFREFAKIPVLGPRSTTLILTNPPLGKRVPIPNLKGLIEALFTAASTTLKPGGRFILANPFQMDSPEPSLKLDYRKAVDFGGFECLIEKYIKLPR